MIKAFSAVLVSFVLLSSCHKMGPGGCDPGPGGMMATKYDVGFYRGSDTRPESDYVSVDGGSQSLLSSPEETSNVTCSTTGILHYSLLLGTHTITIYMGNVGTPHTLILSKTGATFDGTQLPSQSCNSGLSAVIADM